MHTSRVFLLAAVLAMLPSVACADQPTLLVDNGNSTYTIVISPNASVVVQNAAGELAGYILQMSGAAIPVLNAPTGVGAIYIGPDDAAAKAFPNVRFDGIPTEGFTIETNGPNLLITGDDDRGVMYGVYWLLENQLGVGWYGPDATVVPRSTTIPLPNVHVSSSPAFTMRDTNAGVVPKSAAWDAHIGLNGSDVPTDPKFGGNYPLFDGDENFYDLVPPTKYFKVHPEYYSLIDGVRTTIGKEWGNAQLCLTNPDVFDIVGDALANEAAEDPSRITLGLSPNDAPDGQCQDPACKASDAKYGAPSGTLLNFVNREAARLQTHFPGRSIWLETLAYQYNERPPKPGSISPASNVLVCLCPIWACDAHPMAKDPDSEKSRAALDGWSKVAKGHLQIWHYATNFQNFLQPFPDFDELGGDMSYYRHHGVSGVFVESDYQNGSGEMEPMRTWILAHLLWNPDQDIWGLVQRFCNGYYGRAGADMFNYVKLLHSPFQDRKLHLHIYDNATSAVFSPLLITQAEALFNDARGLSTTPEEETRIDRMHLGLEYVELMEAIPGKSAGDSEQAAWKAKAAAFALHAHQFDITYIGEGHLLSDWEKDPKQPQE